LAVIGLLAAFLVTALLTLSNIAKRVREIGTLRALGWSRRRVMRQIMAETLTIGIVGAVVGVAVGFAACAVIGAVGPGLTATTSGLAVGASTASNLFHQSTTATVHHVIHLQAPVSAAAIGVGVAAALVGGAIAGAAGGWRAARLAPASALRDLG
jgi:ABC-type antimicrobial peptide transport system permease subunit